MEKAIKKKPIYAVFDIGKTNKKLILFDEDRQMVSEHLHVCTDAYDEDGDACDHLPRLAQWVQAHWQALQHNPLYTVKGLNFTAYGAALVHLDAAGEAFLPLYSNRKPLPPECAERFYVGLGQSAEAFALATRSPHLGMLNAGLQLYWLKHTRPEQYARIHTSLHLPQYLSYLITGDKYSDYSSVGCHTALWDFERQDYHAWVYREGLDEKLAPLIKDSVSAVADGVLIGVGLHDTSAAAVAYLFENAGTDFVLVSTGAWCAALNPFAPAELTPGLLGANCVNYLSPRGEPVLAARWPLGQEHDYQVQRMAEHFNVRPDFYRSLMQARPAAQLRAAWLPTWPATALPEAREWPLAPFNTATDAYQHLMYALVQQVAAGIKVVRQQEPVLFVDGGFARNPLFMQYLGHWFPDVALRTLEVPQATAIGALIHLEQGEARKKTQPLFA
ncbi:FGGY family carbohydrate kinase [Hymenobacter sp. M29]|uniref:FGGY family carbohydrate kinase n=1 Tax=Hymenobacter mellowenesis TaxID=3063995 RepID=A0ABT9A8S9_9BACT|nr:FGGY family carbohydrate kinase [Hymenobacter sp. M29]MDO7846249.1 FGGY family carbohydrate kinase [Hymenobacter sp. M29]